MSTLRNSIWLFNIVSSDETIQVHGQQTGNRCIRIPFEITKNLNDITFS